MINKTIKSYIILVLILLCGSVLSFFVRQKLESKINEKSQPQEQLTIATPQPATESSATTNHTSQQPNKQPIKPVP